MSRAFPRSPSDYCSGGVPQSTRSQGRPRRTCCDSRPRQIQCRVDRSGQGRPLAVVQRRKWSRNRCSSAYHLGRWRSARPGARRERTIVAAAEGRAKGAAPHVDVMFPVLHGPNGEDRTIQGPLDLADVPYVGSSVIEFAAAMDKDVAKRLARDAGLSVVPFATLTAQAPLDYATVVRASAAPTIRQSGRSGIVCRHIPRTVAEEFAQWCALAFQFDGKILAERCIDRAREIECSVLEDEKGTVRASPLGEIVPADKHGFYSYEAKYTDSTGASLIIPADVPPERTERIQELAIKTFQVLGCGGLARVDFFLKGEEIFVNEVNTLPGFTSISMYPKLWEASGVSQPELMDILIAHALARHARRRRSVERGA